MPYQYQFINSIITAAYRKLFQDKYLTFRPIAETAN